MFDIIKYVHVITLTHNYVDAHNYVDVCEQSPPACASEQQNPVLRFEFLGRSTPLARPGHRGRATAHPAVGRGREHGQAGRRTIPPRAGIP